MYSSAEWRLALSKILELTSKGVISWKMVDPIAEDVWAETDRTYIAEYKGSIYGVSAIRRKHYLDEDDWVWSSDYVLNFYERDDEKKLVRIASAPEVNSIQNIYQLAHDSFASKKNILGNLLMD